MAGSAYGAEGPVKVCSLQHAVLICVGFLTLWRCSMSSQVSVRRSWSRLQPVCIQHGDVMDCQEVQAADTAPLCAIRCGTQGCCWTFMCQRALRLPHRCVCHRLLMRLKSSRWFRQSVASVTDCICCCASAAITPVLTVVTVCLQVPQEFTGFCYVYEGAGKIGGAKARIEQNLVMGEGMLPWPCVRLCYVHAAVLLPATALCCSLRSIADGRWC